MAAMQRTEQLAKAILQRGQHYLDSATAEEGSFLGDCVYTGLPVCGPYGIFWRAPDGSEVLTTEHGGNRVVIGTIMAAEQLNPGEICLHSLGGARLILCRDGTVEINGLRITKEGQIVPKKEGDMSGYMAG